MAYDNGQGVPQDYVAAYKWFILAKAGAKAGGESYKAAGQLMDALGGALMTPAQVAQAQAEAAAWWQAHPKAHGGQQ